MRKFIGVLRAMVLLANCASIDTGNMSSEWQNKTGFLKGYYDRLQP